MSGKQARLLAKEQPRHVTAFERYYGLGELRSYKRIANEFGIALSTVKLWGKSFRWNERIQGRELQIARDVANRTIGEEVSRRERSLQIVQMALLQLAKAVAEGQVKMTLGDLDRIIRLEAFLCDEPDSRQEIVLGDLSDKSDEDLKEIVRQELSAIREIERLGPDS